MEEINNQQPENLPLNLFHRNKLNGDFRGKGCNKEDVETTSGISMYFVNPLDITCKAKLNCSLLTLVRKKIE